MTANRPLAELLPSRMNIRWPTAAEVELVFVKLVHASSTRNSAATAHLRIRILSFDIAVHRVLT
jgi:hypothetical protein